MLNGVHQTPKPILDQLVFTVRVGYRNLHDILSDGFGPGRISRSYVRGKYQWGLTYSAIGVWCSRYRNIHGYSPSTSKSKV